MSKSAENSFDVVRNGVTISFVPTSFERGERKKAGIKFPYTGDITADTLPDFIKWMGDDNFFGMVNASWRLATQQTFDAVLKNADGGEYNEVLMKQYLEELSTRGETLKEIQEKIIEANNKLVALLPRIAQAQVSMNQDELLSVTKEFGVLTTEIQKLQVAFNSKKRTSKADKEDGEAEAEEAVATP